MSVSRHEGGTQLAVIGTEHFLSSPDISGLFQFYVSLDEMQAGDVLELRVRYRIHADDPTEGTLKATYTGVQDADDKVKFSIPIGQDLAEADALQFTLKQTAGIGRSFRWKVLKYL